MGQITFDDLAIVLQVSDKEKLKQELVKRDLYGREGVYCALFDCVTCSPCTLEQFIEAYDNVFAFGYGVDVDALSCALRYLSTKKEEYDAVVELNNVSEEEMNEMFSNVLNRVNGQPG